MLDNLMIYIPIVVVNTYNRFVCWTLIMKVIDIRKRYFQLALIDIELKRKAERLPNLTTLLKSQMKYEQEH